MNKITDMTDENLLGEGRRLLQRLHELQCLQGKPAQPKQERATEDRFIEVCVEIGVRQLAERFKSVLAGSGCLPDKHEGGTDERPTL